ncbi:hypothetical protein N0V86_007345 [Didymella sp. IMI 355093]|nr:hypothetical protein N0V86_007345 [Didymella sp. IMI 355093]
MPSKSKKRGRSDARDTGKGNQKEKGKKKTYLVTIEEQDEPKRKRKRRRGGKATEDRRATKNAQKLQAKIAAAPAGDEGEEDLQLVDTGADADREELSRDAWTTSSPGQIGRSSDENSEDPLKFSDETGEETEDEDAGREGEKNKGINIGADKVEEEEVDIAEKEVEEEGEGVGRVDTGAATAEDKVKQEASHETLNL